MREKILHSIYSSKPKKAQNPVNRAKLVPQRKAEKFAASVQEFARVNDPLTCLQVFSFCLAVYALNVLFLCVWPLETRGPRADRKYLHLSADIPSSVKERGFFNYRHFLDVWRICFKPRPYNMRPVLIALISIMTLNFTAFSK